VRDTDPSEHDGGLQYGTDSLGVYAWLCVDPVVFPQIAILKTAYWCTDRYYAYLARTADGKIRVELRHKTAGTADELTTACREFCNHLLDQTVRHAVLQETAAVRDALVRKAFFDVQDPTAAEAAQANECYVPRPQDSYQADPLGIAKRRQ